MKSCAPTFGATNIPYLCFYSWNSIFARVDSVEIGPATPRLDVVDRVGLEPATF